MPDHDISLDDLLADAATELRSCDMPSLARAVDIAREMLDRPETGAPRIKSTRLEELDG